MLGPISSAPLSGESGSIDPALTAAVTAAATLAGVFSVPANFVAAVSATAGLAGVITVPNLAFDAAITATATMVGDVSRNPSGLIFMDGFEIDRSLTAYATKASAFTSPMYARFGGSGLLLSGNAPYVKLYLEQATNILIVGIAVFPTDAGYNFHDYLFRFLNAQGGVHAGVLINTNWQLVGYGQNETVLGTSTATISSTAWSYVEVKVVVHATAGSLEVRVNDSVVLNFTNVNTMQGSSNSIDSIVLGKTFVTITSIAGKFDDFYVLDGTIAGTGFLQDIVIRQLQPIADDSVQFTPSTGGSNYALVEETPPDGTDYVSSASTSHRDLYTLADSPTGTAEVVGVRHVLLAQKTDGTTRKLRGVLRDGSNEHVTATRYLTIGDAIYQQIFDQRPGGAGNWTTAALDALKAGVEMVP